MLDRPPDERWWQQSSSRKSEERERTAPDAYKEAVARDDFVWKGWCKFDALGTCDKGAACQYKHGPKAQAVLAQKLEEARDQRQRVLKEVLEKVGRSGMCILGMPRMEPSAVCLVHTESSFA